MVHSKQDISVASLALTLSVCGTCCLCATSKPLVWARTKAKDKLNRCLPAIMTKRMRLQKEAQVSVRRMLGPSDWSISSRPGKGPKKWIDATATDTSEPGVCAAICPGIDEQLPRPRRAASPSGTTIPVHICGDVVLQYPVGRTYRPIHYGAYIVHALLFGIPTQYGSRDYWRHAFLFRERALCALGQVDAALLATARKDDARLDSRIVYTGGLPDTLEDSVLSGSSASTGTGCSTLRGVGPQDMPPPQGVSDSVDDACIAEMQQRHGPLFPNSAVWGWEHHTDGDSGDQVRSRPLSEPSRSSEEMGRGKSAYVDRSHGDRRQLAAHAYLAPSSDVCTAPLADGLGHPVGHRARPWSSWGAPSSAERWGSGEWSPAASPREPWPEGDLRIGESTAAAVQQAADGAPLATEQAPRQSWHLGDCSRDAGTARETSSTRCAGKVVTARSPVDMRGVCERGQDDAGCARRQLRAAHVCPPVCAPQFTHACVERHTSRCLSASAAPRSAGPPSVSLTATRLEAVVCDSYAGPPGHHRRVDPPLFPRTSLASRDSCHGSK